MERLKLLFYQKEKQKVISSLFGVLKVMLEFWMFAVSCYTERCANTQWSKLLAEFMFLTLLNKTYTKLICFFAFFFSFFYPFLAADAVQWLIAAWVYITLKVNTLWCWMESAWLWQLCHWRRSLPTSCLFLSNDISWMFRFAPPGPVWPFGGLENKLPHVNGSNWEILLRH